jgi:AraC family transcriptional regulator, arabinose operon regulatory protein
MTWTIIWQCGYFGMERAEGFPGQDIVVIPRRRLAEVADDPILAVLRVTDCGFYPLAKYHAFIRDNGCVEAILMVCIDGHGQVRSGQRRLSVEAGDVVLIPPQCPHSYHAHDLEPWTIAWVHMDGSLILPWLTRLGVSDGPVVRRLTDVASARRAHGEVLARLHRGDQTSALIAAAAALWEFLATIERGLESRISAEIARSLQVMAERMDTPLALAQLARTAGLSRSQFSARFLREVGSPPMEHFLRLRMRRAAALLASTEVSIADLSQHLGFADPFHFSRCFRRIHGVPPTVMRNSYYGS